MDEYTARQTNVIRVARSALSSSLSTNDSVDPPSPTRNEDLARAELGVLSAILALTVSGNGFVVVVLFLLKRVKKLTRMNLMIAHLAFADLFVGVFHVLPQLAWKATFLFQGGQYLCKLVTYFQLVAMYGSSYVLLATALDRYVAICYPLKMHVWGPRRMNFVVFVSWTLSGIFSLPQFFIFSFGEHPTFSGVYECNGTFEPIWTIKLYVTWVTSAIYVIPTILLVILYSKICGVVWSSAKGLRRSQRKRTPQEEVDSTDQSVNRRYGSGQNQRRVSAAKTRIRNVSDAKVKTVKLTMAVIVSYVICYGPFFVSQMWAAWDEEAPFEETAMVIIMLLASLNSCTNPWIYLAFNGHISRFLPCGSKRIHGRHRHGTSQRERLSKNSSSNFHSNSRYNSTVATTATASNQDSLRMIRLFQL